MTSGRLANCGTVALRGALRGLGGIGIAVLLMGAGLPSRKVPTPLPAGKDPAKSVTGQDINQIVDFVSALGAQQGSALYPTVASGLAATPEGGMFVVVGDVSTDYATVQYRKEAGAAVEVARHPTKETVDQVNRRVADEEAARAAAVAAEAAARAADKAAQAVRDVGQDSRMEGLALGVAGDPSALAVKAAGSTTARSLSAIAADEYNIAAFGCASDGLTLDTACAQEAVDAAFARGGGTVVVPGPTVASVTLKSGVRLRGTSGKNSILYAPANDAEIVAIAAGSRNVEVSGLTLNANGRSGVTAVKVNGAPGSESQHISIRDVWIQSAHLGVYATWSYFGVIDNVRMHGVDGGITFDAMANSWRVTGAHIITGTDVATNFGMISHNNTGIEVTQSTFEWWAPVRVYHTNGFSISGCYFESTDPTKILTWLTVGHGTAVSNGGYSITGNNFGVGADYGIGIQSVQGVEVSGNAFGTTLAAVRIDSWAGTDKHTIHVSGSNQFWAGAPTIHDPTKMIVASSYDGDSPATTDLLSWTYQPFAFTTTVVPKDDHLLAGTGALYFAGGTLNWKWKREDGTVRTTPLAGGRHFRLIDAVLTGGTTISTNGGYSANYNGTWITTNEDTLGAQGNSTLPSWALDVGGTDGLTRPVSADAFTVWRKPAGGAYANVLTVNASGVVTPGTLKIGEGNTAAAPACNAGRRGSFHYQGGAAGAKDSVQVCAKDAADDYAWRPIY